jgi:integrase
MAYVTCKRGVFYVVEYQGINPVTGRERRRWHRCADANHAGREAQRLTKRRGQHLRRDTTATLGEYLVGRWLPSREHTATASTFASYAASIRHYVLPYLGPTAMTRITAQDLNALYRRLAIAGAVRGGGLSAKTIKNMHQTLHAAFADAVHDRLIADNPADHASAPDPRKRPSSRRRAKSWTATELGAFLSATRSERLYMLFELAAATGMRRGELLGLQWGDIHFGTGTIEVTRALTAVAYRLDCSTLKTRTSRRCITIDARTLRYLADWRDRPGVVASPDQPVFTGANGAALHPHAASQAFCRAVRHADVPSIRFHDVRHTHATLLLRDRVPIKVVSERLGHSTPAFTMMTYQHVLPGMQEDAARSYEELVAHSFDESTATDCR